MISAVLAAGVARADTWYVDVDAAPGGDGTSWATAFHDLHEALAAATVGDEVWLAEGIYHPAPPGGDQQIEFALPAGVAVYGGFMGLELSREERDPAAHPTILSGDLNGNDGPGFENSGDNSRCVVSMAASVDPNSPSRLDGVVVSGGRNAAEGGGIRVGSRGSIVLANVEISDNYARGGGAGALIEDADAVIEGCRFTGNAVGGGSIADGGGAKVERSARLTIRDSSFDGNKVLNASQGGSGGALFLQSVGSLVVERSDFRDNRGQRDGGAVAMYDIGSAQFNDCIFHGNECLQLGGAIESNGCGDLRVSDSRFEFNRTFDAFSTIGGAVDSWDPATLIVNCTFEGNSSMPEGGGSAEGSGGALRIRTGGEVRDCVFIANQALTHGAALMATGAPLTIESCEFRDNVGGASIVRMESAGPGSTAHLRHCRIVDNTIDSGAVLDVTSYGGNLLVEHVELVDNNAIGAGVVLREGPHTLRYVTVENSGLTGIKVEPGAPQTERTRIEACIIRNNGSHEFFDYGSAGGLHLRRGEIDVVNCLIAGNRGIWSAGVRAQTIAEFNLVNCTIVGNRTGEDCAGGAVASDRGIPNLYNCIIWDNGPQPLWFRAVAEYCVVEGGYPGTGNIDASPLFTDPLRGDFSLQAGSPAIDAACTDFLPDGVRTDLAGRDRMVDDPGTVNTGSGEWDMIDIGASEFEAVTPAFRISTDPGELLSGLPFQVMTANALPFAETWLFASNINTGQEWNALLGVTLGLYAPEVLGTPAMSDEHGIATFDTIAPEVVGTLPLWLQAAQSGAASVVRAVEIVR